MTTGYPYRRPAHDSVRPDVWSSRVAEGSVPLPDVLSDWDYNTVLDLARTVAVDGRRVRSESGLTAGARLHLSVRWTASGSLLRGLAARVDVPLEDGCAIELAFALPGSELGGTLTLDTMLSTATGGAGGERVPSRPGSVLWIDSFDVRLQGDAPLFPVAISDFGDLPYPDGASWFLQIHDDLDAAAMGSMLLLVNAQSEILVRALSEAANPSPDAHVALSTLRTEVAATLIEQALAADGFDPTDEYPARSLGATFGALAAQLGLDDWDSLRRERDSEPALFAARLQGATKMWEGLR